MALSEQKYENANELEVALTDTAKERLRTWQWIVFGIAGDAALRPIEDFLRDAFGVEGLDGTILIFARRGK